MDREQQDAALNRKYPPADGHGEPPAYTGMSLPADCSGDPYIREFGAYRNGPRDLGAVLADEGWHLQQAVDDLRRAAMAPAENDGEFLRHVRSAGNPGQYPWAPPWWQPALERPREESRQALRAQPDMSQADFQARENVRLRERLEAVERLLRDSRDRLDAAERLAAQSERYRDCLRDVLALFSTNSSGWARSACVSLDDLNGWLELARHGRVREW